MMDVLTAAAESRPAGGAAFDQVLIASGAALFLTAALLVLGYGHRSGRLPLLSRLADLARRPGGEGLPGWAALPSALSLVSLVTALLGMYWDISLHITHGRDEGPLANIAHYPILIGLFGIFASGAVALALPVAGRPGPVPIRITRSWYAPTGGVLLAGAGFYALLGFPLDDVWHRIFGQDVTLWGPTHLMLIGGAGLSLVTLMILEREGRAAGPQASGTARYLRRGTICGGLLIGLSVFQAEYDFGVPQFRLVHQPMLIALAAGCALVAARLWGGRGSAVFAVVFYMLVRGGVSIIVGPVIGELTPSVPLYLAEALCVEVLAVALLKRELLFGVASGLAIGTVGFAAEYGWSQFAMVLPWNGDMVVEGVLMAIAGGVAGGVLGALLALAMDGRLPRPALSGSLFAGSLALVAVAVANGLVLTVPHDVTAQVTLAGEHDGKADATITFSKPFDHPTWVTVTAWQGGGLHVDRLTRTGPATYRTTSPMPLNGDWKTLIRVHDGRALAGVPLYLPRDEAIGAQEVAATSRFTRPLQGEKSILQRELKTDVPGWLWGAACLIVLACTLALGTALGWGAARISRGVRTQDLAAVRSGT